MIKERSKETFQQIEENKGASGGAGRKVKTSEELFNEIEERRTEKVDDLTSIFKEKLTFYESEKAKDIQKLLEQKRAITKENKLMIRHLNEAAKAFIVMRKNRNKPREQKQ